MQLDAKDLVELIHVAVLVFVAHHANAGMGTIGHFKGLYDQQAHLLGGQADLHQRNGAMELDQRGMKAASHDDIGPRRFVFHFFNPFQRVKLGAVIDGQAQGLPVHAVAHQHAPGSFHHVFSGQQAGDPHQKAPPLAGMLLFFDKTSLFPAGFRRDIFHLQCRLSTMNCKM